MAAARRVSELISILVISFASVPAAQAQRTMTPVDIIDVPAISNPQLSPDGTQVVYQLSTADWNANRRVDHIWRVNSDGTDAVQLTNGPDGETSPKWSPDARFVGFLAKRGADEETQIYLMRNNGGEARALTAHASAISNIAWSPDGQWIYFVAPDPKGDEEKAREKAKDDVFAFDENYKQRHLWRVSVSDGKVERITEGPYSVTGYTLSDDGTRIVMHRAPDPLFDSSLESEIWVVRADGKDAKQLTRNRVPEMGAALSPDNRNVIFTAGADEALRETYYNRKVFIVPTAGGAPRRLAGDLTYEVGQTAWSRDGKSIYFSANMGVRNELFVMDPTGGAVRQLTDGKHSVDAWHLVTTADRLVMAVAEPDNPGDLWIMPLASPTPTRVTTTFEYLARDFKLPRQERIEWKGADGVTVEGLLYYPIGYRPGQRYPLCVQTHGGPQASDKFGFAGGWGSYVPVLTGMGYAVLKPNYRGSTGYGDPFLRDMVGSYYKNSHLDVMAGVDHLVKIGIADPDRMVKMGWSAGGHMTNKIITFTDRFKAAASGAGASNWVSMYAQSDTRVYRTPWFGGTPWQMDAPLDIYRDHSPLTFASKVGTPTIFLVGERDERVPPEQSVEMYRALKSNGVPTHLYIAPRAGHGWTELRHALYKMNVELDWFERHATKRRYVWQRAPTDERAKTAASSTGGRQH